MEHNSVASSDNMRRENLIKIDVCKVLASWYENRQEKAAA